MIIKSYSFKYTKLQKKLTEVEERLVKKEEVPQNEMKHFQDLKVEFQKWKEKQQEEAGARLSTLVERRENISEYKSE